MSIYKRASGRYAVLIDLDPTATGLRRRRSIGTYRTRKEAERAEREALEARDRGIDLSPRTVTVGELIARYLTDARGRVGERTLFGYQGLADTYILPKIASIPLAKLKPAHVSELYAHLIERGGKGGRALSARTVGHVHTLVHGILAWAVRMELAGRNVADAVRPAKAVRRESRALSVEEAQSLILETKGNRFGNLYTFALATGIRRGELCALKWSDVDSVQPIVCVRASVSIIGKRIAEKGTKSGRVRCIHLSGLAIDALKAQKALQAKHELLLPGQSYQRSGYVFTDEIGRRLVPSVLTSDFYRTAKRLGLSVTSFHALRHTNASLMIASGVDVRTAASVLGHSSPSVTLNVYSHLVAGTQAAAVAAVDARLRAQG